MYAIGDDGSLSATIFRALIVVNFVKILAQSVAVGIAIILAMQVARAITEQSRPRSAITATIDRISALI